MKGAYYFNVALAAAASCCGERLSAAESAAPGGKPLEWRHLLTAFRFAAAGAAGQVLL